MPLKTSMISANTQNNSGLSINESSRIIKPKSTPNKTTYKIAEQKKIEKAIKDNPEKYEIKRDSKGNIISIKKKEIGTFRSSSKYPNIRKEYNPLIYNFKNGKLVEITEKDIKFDYYPSAKMYDGTLETIKNIKFDYDKNQKIINDKTKTIQQKYDKSNTSLSNSFKQKENPEKFIVKNNNVMIQDSLGNTRQVKEQETSQALNFLKERAKINTQTSKTKTEGSSSAKAEYFDPVMFETNRKQGLKFDSSSVKVFKDEKGIKGFQDNVAKVSVSAGLNERFNEKDIADLQRVRSLQSRQLKELDKDLKNASKSETIFNNILNMKTEPVKKESFLEQVNKVGDKIKDVFEDNYLKVLEKPEQSQKINETKKTETQEIKGFNVDDYGGFFGKVNKKVNEGIDWLGSKYFDLVQGARIKENIRLPKAFVPAEGVLPKVDVFNKKYGRDVSKTSFQIGSYFISKKVGTARMSLNVASGVSSGFNPETLPAIKKDPINAGVQYGFIGLQAGALGKIGYDKWFNPKTKAFRDTIKKLNEISKGSKKIKFDYSPYIYKQNKQPDYNTIMKIKENIKTQNPDTSFVIGLSKSDDIIIRDNIVKGKLSRIILNKKYPSLKFKINYKDGSNTAVLDFFYKGKFQKNFNIFMPKKESHSIMIEGQRLVTTDKSLGKELNVKQVVKQTNTFSNKNIKANVKLKSIIEQTTKITKPIRKLKYDIVFKNGVPKNILLSKKTIKPTLLIGKPQPKPDELIRQNFVRNNKIVKGLIDVNTRASRMKTSLRIKNFFNVKGENIIKPNFKDYFQNAVFNDKYLYSGLAPIPKGNFNINSLGKTQFNIDSVAFNNVGVVKAQLDSNAFNSVLKQANLGFRLTSNTFNVKQSNKYLDLIKGLSGLNNKNLVNNRNILDNSIQNKNIIKSMEKAKEQILNKNLNLTRNKTDSINKLITKTKTKTKTSTDSTLRSLDRSSYGSGSNNLGSSPNSPSFTPLFPSVPVPNIIDIPNFDSDIKIPKKFNFKRKFSKMGRKSGEYTNPVPNPFKKLKNLFKGVKL